jgi:MGT family glycosyltransferase
MAKFLISTMPATGHVNPILSTVEKLVERGHQVVWHSGPAMETKIKATGANFVAFKHTPDVVSDVMAAQELKGINGAIKAIINLFVEPMLGQLKDYQEILENFPADAVIVDMCSLGARLLSEKGGPVWASIGINPLKNADSPMFGSGKPPAMNDFTRFNNRMMNWVGNHLMLKDVTTRFNSDRNKVGLSAVSKNYTVFDFLDSPFLHLQGTTPAFEFPYKHIPPQIHFVGPMLPPMPTDFTPPKWWDDLKSGRPVVHVTQGTVATDPKELVLPTIEAMKSKDVLVVVTTPNPEKLGTIPSNVRIERMIPHSVLLPFVDVMVTSGGYNGVKVALAHGVPLIGAGSVSDQPDVCSRVAYSGAGINLRTGRPSSSQLKQSILKVLNDPSYLQKAKLIQSDFALHDSAAETTQLLERLAKTKKAILR